MTDYNDGKWHVWNGGECPVHSRSVVEVLHAEKGILDERAAGVILWDHKDLIAFRVVKEHKEPREWFIDTYTMQACKSQYGRFTIHVREVIDNE